MNLMMRAKALVAVVKLKKMMKAVQKKVFLKKLNLPKVIVYKLI
jgi:hypothetical protein